MGWFRSALPLCLFALSAVAAPPRPYFQVATHRMDVDVDGAPTAYGPAGLKTLDYLKNAHTLGNLHAPIVGYMLTRSGRPIIQGPHDPAPGYYVSQTTFEDEHFGVHDPRRYVDATRINYVVLGDRARAHGVRIGDFVSVFSTRTRRAVYGIVADSGNPSGDEGSLHLLQSLGYPFHDGRREAVERRGEILIRYFPGSNPHGQFFHDQPHLDAAATSLGLNRDFSASHASK